jgi:hypothetical protein
MYYFTILFAVHTVHMNILFSDKMFLLIYVYINRNMDIKPGGWQYICVTRNSWERKPRGVKTTESEFSDPIPLAQQILHSYS